MSPVHAPSSSPRRRDGEQGVLVSVMKAISSHSGCVLAGWRASDGSQLVNLIKRTAHQLLTLVQVSPCAFLIVSPHVSPGVCVFVCL